MKLKPYIPYPISLMRLFMNLIGVSVVAIFVDTARANRVDVDHPFFLFVCLFILGCFGFASHYPINWVLKRMKAKTYHDFVDSLWEGVLLVLVTVNSLVCVLFGFFGLFYQQLKRGIIPDALGSSPLLNDLPGGAWWAFGWYCAIALFFYQVEYLARNPDPNPPKGKNQPPQRKSPPVLPTADNDIDQDLRQLKTRLDNKKRFDK